MPKIRKVRVVIGAEPIRIRATRNITAGPHLSEFVDQGPELILYRAPSEKIVQAPDDVLQLLRAEDIVQEGRGRVRNPITHGEHSFVAVLAQHQETLIALSAAIVSPIIAWLKMRKGRKIEIRKGDMKVSAGSVKELRAALASFLEYEKLTLRIKKSQSQKKRKEKRANL
jgi:hypothetical protein